MTQFISRSDNPHLPIENQFDQRIKKDGLNDPKETSGSTYHFEPLFVSDEEEYFSFEI